MYSFRGASYRLNIVSFLFLGIINGATGTDNVSAQITGSDTDAFAVLSCKVNSTAIGSHLLTWHRQSGEEMVLILKMNPALGVKTYGSFHRRISLGDEGALVVTRPSIGDSGNYLCEVGGAISHRVEVKLEIKAVNTSKYCWSVFFIALDWLVPIGWLIYFTIERTGMWMTWFRALNTKEKLKDVFALVGAILTFISLICLSANLANGYYHIQFSDSLLTVGLVFGILGILFLIVPLVLLIVSFRLRKKEKMRSAEAGHYYESSGVSSNENEGDLILHEEHAVEPSAEDVIPQRDAEKTATHGEDDTITEDKVDGSSGDRKDTAPKDKSGTFPRDSRELLPKDKGGSLSKAKARTMPKNKQETLPKDKEKRGIFKKFGKSKRGTLPKETKVKVRGNVDETDNTEDTDKSSLLPPTELTQLNWNETILTKPTEGNRVKCMVFVPDKGLFLCEDHSIYNKSNLQTGEYVKLLDNPEVNFSALVYDPKQEILFFLARTEKEGFYVASVDPKAPDESHRIRINLPKFPARYHWMYLGQKSLYLTERKNKQIEIFSKLGKRESAFGDKVLGEPVCIAQNKALETFVADSKHGDVFVFKRDGKLQTSFGGKIPADVKQRMTGCHRLTISDDGRIFVATPTSSTLLLFSSDFKPLATLSTGSETSGPISSIMHANNSLYVAQDDGIHIYTEADEA